MKKDVLTLATITEIVKPIALKYNVEAVYLFGSYARGEATADSDLDSGRSNDIHHFNFRII